MSKKTLKEEWNDFTKTDKVGFIITILINILLIIFVIYFLYFSQEFDDLLLKFVEYPNPLLGLIYYIMFLVGMVVTIFSINKLIKIIFYPESETEKLMQKQIREFKKKYPLRLANKYIKKLKLEHQLKGLNYKINDWHKKWIK